MTDPSGLGDAILLRLTDRLASVEQQAATNAAAMRAMGDSIVDLRQLIAGLAHDFNELRTISSDTLQSFEQMRAPLQGLLDLRARLSGAWLAATALLMVVAYLLQPLLGQIYHWRLGGP